MPVIGIIHHRGRNTGRPYATPLGIRPATANGFVMPLTFGESAGWYRKSWRRAGASSHGAALTTQ
jgi:hypothetical protein